MDLTYLTSTEYIKQSANRIYIAPHSLLKKYIAHYTYLYGCDCESKGVLTIIPDASGCMIFETDGISLKCHLWGPTTKAVTVGDKADKTTISIFAEFLPCGLYRLTGIDINELTDLQIHLKDVLPDFEKNIKRLFELSNTITDFINGLNNLFIKTLDNIKASDFGTSLIGYMHQTGGVTTVKQICENVYYSERHINRVLSSELGLNAKGYINLLRINKALQLIKNGQNNFAVLAQQLGFYDQPHFIHSFKLICGVTPTEYKNKMSEFYNEDYKF